MTKSENRLYQIIYLSKLLEHDERLIKNIIDRALWYNPRNDITGMMLYADGDILQVLEGPQKDVTALFEKIKRDPRHQDIFIVLDEILAARHFPEWSMGYKKIDLLDKADFLHYKQVFRGTTDAITQRSVPGVAIEVINAFCAWAMAR